MILIILPVFLRPGRKCLSLDLASPSHQPSNHDPPPRNDQQDPCDGQCNAEVDPECLPQRAERRRHAEQTRDETQWDEDQRDVGEAGDVAVLFDGFARLFDGDHGDGDGEDLVGVGGQVVDFGGYAEEVREEGCEV